MEAGLHPAMLNPVALAGLAALILVVSFGAAARESGSGGPPATTARQDLWLARHRVATALVLLTPPDEEPAAGSAAGERVAEGERRILEALAQIRRARAKPGWNEVPADGAASLVRALPEVEQALALLPHCRDGDTLRRIAAVLEELHDLLDRVA
ncbi:hypothetical protein [Azospirillum halopraeferens]|uniref:hypothetical protein n=1 Tax=Azospirillum halopraeferens TaxID=34010 RepID=UPI0003FCE9E8|nr:hypothetical protein [Azospirillum halopraeferens]